MKPTLGRALTFISAILAMAAASPARAPLSYPTYPVVSRVQFLFSVVTHYNSVSQRVNFYNSSGIPASNQYYSVPHLVYEPAVTLYNPYNWPLRIHNGSRIKIWDPPVGFSFKKNANPLRQEFIDGEFLGLARFQTANEANPDARKTFTLCLTQPRPNQMPGYEIYLLPGESKTFTCWMEKSWEWGYEGADGDNPHAIFDWRVDLDLTNRDKRTINPFGHEAVPAPWPYYNRSGFQTDCLSVTTGRPSNTFYSFETGSLFTKANWVAIKNTDTFTVQAKAMRTNPGNGADFQVDLLKGDVIDPAADLVKAFPMSIGDIIQNDLHPVITRTFRANSLIQAHTDLTEGGKTPFATVTMIAKTSALRANRFYESPPVPTSELYEMHFTEAVSTVSAPVRSSDAPTGAPEILGHARIGNTLYIDFSGAFNLANASTWKVRGTSSLADGFPDDLGSVTTIQAGQAANGIYKAAIDITGKGDRYFIRIEE